MLPESTVLAASHLLLLGDSTVHAASSHLLVLACQQLPQRMLHPREAAVHAASHLLLLVHQHLLQRMLRFTYCCWHRGQGILQCTLLDAESHLLLLVYLTCCEQGS